MLSSLLAPHELKAFLEQGMFLLKPEGELLLGFGSFLGAKAPGNPEWGVYLPGFFADKERLVYPSELRILNSFSTEGFQQRQLSEPQWQSPQYEKFRDQVLRAQTQFHESELRKVVPVVRWTSEWQPKDEVKQSLIENLLHFAAVCGSSRQTAYTYGYWTADSGFMGRTPEILFSMSDRQFRTMALAGTNWAGKNIQFLQDKKEQEEHRWVVEEILSKLKDLGEFRAAEMQVLPYGSIEHLLTPIEGRLTSSVEIKKLTQRLHPTPALGGFPQSLARHWLLEQSEARWRGDFGAPMVWFRSNDEGIDQQALGLVLIRGLFWNKGTSSLPVGCGIVSDSKPDKEWTELLKKRDSVRRLFGWEKQ